MSDISEVGIFVLLSTALAVLIGLVVSNIVGLLYGLEIGVCVFCFLMGMAAFNLAETNLDRLLGSLIMAIVVGCVAEMVFRPIFGFSVWPYAFLMAMIYFLIQILQREE